MKLEDLKARGLGFLSQHNLNIHPHSISASGSVRPCPERFPWSFPGTKSHHSVMTSRMAAPTPRAVGAPAVWTIARPEKPPKKRRAMERILWSRALTRVRRAKRSFCATSSA